MNADPSKNIFIDSTFCEEVNCVYYYISHSKAYIINSIQSDVVECASLIIISQVDEGVPPPSDDPMGVHVPSVLNRPQEEKKKLTSLLATDSSLNITSFIIEAYQFDGEEKNISGKLAKCPSAPFK